jgi:hypothetical protein
MKSWHAEIVRVTANHLLSNAAQEAFPYQTRYGTELDPGHYLVLKMDGDEHQYTNGVVFFGPFVSHTQAEVVLQSSRYLGLLTGNKHEKITPPQNLPHGEVTNLPILLRRRPAPYPMADRVVSYKDQRALAN